MRKSISLIKNFNIGVITNLYKDKKYLILVAKPTCTN